MTQADSSDAELINAVRQGDVDAYGQLYERHLPAAHRMARQVTRSQTEADDVVSEAFAKVLALLKDNRGPTEAFRAYLLTSVRHSAYDRTNKAKRVQPTDDVTTVPSIDTNQLTEPFRDTAVEAEDRNLIAEAFARLPERWQTVLWHVEIEGQTPARVAPLLGMTANGVSALAYRAREGLKQQYLQTHLMRLGTEETRCRSVIERLGSWTRDGLSKRDNAQVNEHLDGCDRCNALAAELVEVNSALKVFVAPIVLGGTASAAGYLGLAGSGVAGGGVAASGVLGAMRSHPRKSIAVGGAALAALAALGIALASGHDDPPPAAADPGPDSPGQQEPPQVPPTPPVPPVAVPPPPVPGQVPTRPPAPVPSPVPPPPPVPGEEDPPPIPPPGDHVADAEASVRVPVLDLVEAGAVVGVDVDRDQIAVGADVDVEWGDRLAGR